MTLTIGGQLRTPKLSHADAGGGTPSSDVCAFSYIAASFRLKGFDFEEGGCLRASLQMAMMSRSDSSERRNITPTLLRPTQLATNVSLLPLRVHQKMRRNETGGGNEPVVGATDQSYGSEPRSTTRGQRTHTGGKS